MLKKINISGFRVLVVGSKNPWIEASALAAGSKEASTLEFGKIKCDDPRMHVYTPKTFQNALLRKKIDPFDMVILYSSIEHTGLGRYGDMLNPEGDVLVSLLSWCLTKNDGMFFLQVPRSKKDSVVFNAHRIYGPERYRFLTTNWVEETKISFSEILRDESNLGTGSNPVLYRKQ